MPEGPSSMMYMRTACICVPLRLSVLFSALLTFFIGLVFVCDAGHWQWVFRHFAGGYTLNSQTIVGIGQVTGLGAGLMGTLGIWYAKRQYVNGFLLWQVLRLASWVAMYVIDVPILEACDFFVNDIHRMTEVHGWNPLMYQIAMAGDCGYEQQQFFTLSILTLISLTYLTWTTSRYLQFVDETPKHLLKMPKDPVSAAFFSQSTGERSYLNGRNDEQMPFAPQGPPMMMPAGPPGYPVGGPMQMAQPMGGPGFASMGPSMRLPI